MVRVELKDMEGNRLLSMIPPRVCVCVCVCVCVQLEEKAITYTALKLSIVS